MQNKGLLIVISGFSGVGKGTVVSELLKRYPDLYSLSISATTRPMRPGEEEGVHYFYRTREAFENMIASDSLLEFAEYNGNYYGTPKDYVLSEMESGKNVILEIEVQGALKIRQKFPEAFLIFILPPDARSLYERLVKRGTETEDVIRNRMKRALVEAEYAPYYHVCPVNDDLEKCIEETHSLIINKQKEMEERRRLLSSITEELALIVENK